MNLTGFTIVRFLLLLSLLLGAKPVIAQAGEDTTPPVLYTYLDPGSYSRGPVTVITYANDDSGVKMVYCRFRGNREWQSGESTCSLSAQDNAVIEFYAEDVAGNIAPVQTLDLCKIDRVAPILNPATVTEQSGVFSSSWTRLNDPNFTWNEAADPQLTCGSGQAFAGSGLNGYYIYFGPDAQGTSDQLRFGNYFDPPALFESGTYYLRGRAEDAAGNQGGWVTLFIYKLDLDQPAVSTTTQPTAPDGLNGWFRTRPIIHGEASDPTSNVVELVSQMGGSGWQEVNDLLIPGDGQHLVSYRATDQAGNSESITRVIKVDSELPDIKLILPTSSFILNEWYLNDLTLRGKDELSAYDLSGIASLEYQVSEAGWTNVPPTIAVSGVYPIDVRMSDNASNSTAGRVTVQMDKDGPILIASVSQGSGPVMWGVVNFIGSVQDPQSGISGIFYQVDGGPWRAVSSLSSDGRFA